ncbi:Mutant ACR-23-like protein [Aphelenchoides bicaudatus]|nr:Mutant ACR-23-like protein [Aphelenchoides bicaudatus]
MKLLSFLLIAIGLLTYFPNGVFAQGRWEADASGIEELDEDMQVEHPPQYRLEEYLMKHYNNKLLPRRNPNKPVRVKFRISLYQIVEINEPQQYIMLNSWIVESWQDDFLWWRPEKFDNLTEIVLPHTALWKPDSTLYNSIVMEDSESRRLQSIKVTTIPKHKTTLVELLYPTLYKFSCTLNLRLFPFDAQHCTMTFGSWTYDNKAIDYFPDNASTSAIGTDNCIENEGWNIINTDVYRREQKYACCPNNYTLLEFGIHIQRKPLYYLINLILPTTIITLISIVGFFSSITVNEMREEKISLGITTLLSMSILIFMVSDKMPSTSSFIPLIGWFYMMQTILIAGATLCSSLVINIQKKGIIGQRPSTNTMRWARRVGRLVWLEMPLLMKQAYAIKAKDYECLKRRRFNFMFKAKRRPNSAASLDETETPTLPIYVQPPQPSKKRVMFVSSSPMHPREDRQAATKKSQHVAEDMEENFQTNVR